ncbi:DUF5689 domain-containing protein [Nemorincola caseinilytica]|uniref:DUF5689 domain-containing protein n=1 Tax=Nemorincola caseinilytica TaxID=2054315 RepID=A0ABP8N259_9BACT
MRFHKIALTFLLATATLSSCLKKDYDVPPDTLHYDPALPVNVSLRQLADNALMLSDGQYYTLGDSIAYGIIVADDHSGNIYKQMIVQDTTGGICILVDKTTIYGDYPVGRKVYLRLKGLRLANYKGLPQLVYDYDEERKQSNGIPSSLLADFVVKASYPHTVEPKVLTMADIFSNPSLYINTLIKIEDVQFETSSANVVYSDAVRSTNRYISDCPFNGRLGMYNSSFSKFRGALTPRGLGSITCILSTYNSPQLILRDTTDVNMTKERVCP